MAKALNIAGMSGIGGGSSNAPAFVRSRSSFSSYRQALAMNVCSFYRQSLT